MKYRTTVIASPVNGRAIPIKDVPDPVFAEKVLGDGCALIPSDGRIYSPVDGVVSTVAETRHAYGFSSDDGMEILVHFGLETVSLKGEGFKSLVSVGERVKKGDLVFFTSRSSGKNVGHVGIVVSADNETGEFKFIHASIKGVKVSECEGYYQKRYVGAKRIILE